MSRADVRCEVLPNGLTVLACEAHVAPVAEVQVWARVGAADERPGEAGLAHFHEHMLFKGTDRRGVGDVAGDIEGAGGRVNAYTSLDVTVYHATVPVEAFSLGLDVLSDAVLHSTFDPEEIDREIEVVLEEIRRSEDSPWHVLSEAVFQQAYRVHPYRVPVLGTPESVSTFSRERVRAFFERWYTAANLLVVATGDFDASVAVEEVGAAFADAPRAAVQRERKPEPPQRGARSLVLARPFERASLEMAWPTVSLSHADGALVDLLTYILGGCDSSRLVQHVKERDGHADRIDASSFTPLDPGLAFVSAETDAERVPACVAAAGREVERLRREPVSRDELERARVNFLASESFERESVTGLAQKLGGFHVTAGDWRKEGDYLESVRRATPEDLLRVARAYLAPERATVGAVVTEEAAAGLSAERLEEALGEGAARTTRAFAVPTALPALPRLQGFELSCGAALHVVSRRDVPVVAARAAFTGGLLAEDARTSGLTNFLAAMWSRGTRAHSAAGFARAAEGSAAEIEGFSGRSSQGLTLEVPTAGVDAALELFAEAMLEPAFEPDEVERERRDTLAAIERREDRLGQRAFMLFSETLFHEHPYRGTLLGTAEAVAGFDADGVRAHHERLMRAGNGVIAVSGDIDPEALAARMSSLLAGLAPGDAALPLPPDEPPPREIRTAELRKDRAQAHVVVGFRGLTVVDDDRYALEVISQLLAGQGGSLFLELRDRRSLAYAVSAVNVEGLAPGYFAVYIASAPEKFDEARDGLLDELRALVDAPPKTDALDRARRYLSGSFAIDQQRNAAHAAQVSLNALYGLGPDADDRYPERVGAVSKEDVLRVARRIIDLDAYTLAAVRP